jgi:hypothetical protein
MLFYPDFRFGLTNHTPNPEEPHRMKTLYW